MCACVCVSVLASTSDSVSHTRDAHFQFRPDAHTHTTLTRHMQIHRTMLSQIRLVEDQRQSFKPLPPPPTFVRGDSVPSSMMLPPLRLPSVATVHYHHHQQTQYQYQYPPQHSTQLLPPPSRAFLQPSPMAAPVYHSAPVSAPASPVSPSSHKCSLSFILSNPPPATTTTKSLPSPALSRTSSSDSESLQNEPLDRPHSLKHKRRDPSAATGSKSKYCTTEGCTSRAKHARKCWKHGGSVKCKVADCINRAKSRGVCWSHGGGTTCSHSNCGTIAVSHGFCWAHGGGKRCQVSGCSRPAYERTQNLCATHFKQQRSSKNASHLEAAMTLA